MLSEQSLVSALRPNHPSHATVTAPVGPRHMKNTLSSKHLNSVAPRLSNGITDPAEYRSILKAIHTDTVSGVVSSFGRSRVLDGPRPELSPSERLLSRAERSALAQLRTGECQLLNDFLSKVGRAESAVCPECRYRRHTVNHLFACDAVPTTLTTRDLWVNPATAMRFLQSLPSFSHLISTDPPPPRPPPEPPP